jgi:hypothetical protein
MRIGPQPILLFTRSKEGGFYPTQMRSDYARVEETGEILRPTLSELAAHVLTRYLEVHDKRVPYEYAYGESNLVTNHSSG